MTYRVPRLTPESSLLTDTLSTGSPYLQVPPTEGVYIKQPGSTIVHLIPKGP